ncbi:MAG: hypothetical protein AAF378_25635 [Cyanobacteria bacterium P01_A01_bin.84]
MVLGFIPILAGFGCAGALLIGAAAGIAGIVAGTNAIGNAIENKNERA